MLKTLLPGILSLFAQVDVVGQAAQLPEIFASRHISFRSYDNIEGSPYLFKEWKHADIVMKAGNVYKSVPVKINIYENTIYFQRNDTAYELYPDIISELSIVANPNDSSKKILISTGYNYYGNIASDKIVQIFSKGKISLIKIFKKEIRKEYDDVHSRTVTRFTDLDQYYIIENGKINKVSFSKNKFYTLIADQKDAMEIFLKKENPNLKTPEGFALALNYYNSL